MKENEELLRLRKRLIYRQFSQKQAKLYYKLEIPNSKLKTINDTLSKKFVIWDLACPHDLFCIYKTLGEFGITS
jgi:hypothetical protein